MELMIEEFTETGTSVFKLPAETNIATVTILNDEGMVDPDPVSLGPSYGNKYQIRWFNQTAHQVTITIDYQYEGSVREGGLVQVIIGALKSPFPGAVFVIPPGVGVTSGPIRNDLTGQHQFKYSVQTYKTTNDPRIIINR